MFSLKNVYTFYDPSTKIWSGLPRKPILNPCQGLGDLVFQILERNATKVVQISADSGREITGAEMRLRSIRIAQNLTKMGFGTGKQPEEIITLIVRNGEHTAPIAFACFFLGIAINTLDPSFSRDDLSHMLETVRPSMVFSESDILDELILACASANVTPKIVLTEDHVDGYDHVDSLLQPTGTETAFIPVPTENPSEQLAVLLCSSGTTGRSKAVCLSHSISIAHVAHFFPCHPDDRTLAFSTLYWLSGMFTLLTSTVWGATRIITRKPYDAELALEIIERFRVSVAVLPSSHVLGIVKSPNANPSKLRSLRFPFTGGSMIPVSLKRSFEQLIPGTFLEVVYGFSEIALAVTFTKGEFYRDGSVGFPVAGTKFKIIDDDGAPLDIGQEGEILVKAEYAFRGYLGNDDATKDMLDSEGWLHSGDIGRFDEDGYLYVVDRKKDIIKCSGYQVSPSEIESVILDIPGVAAACVVGIPAEVFDLAAALVVRISSTENRTLADATEIVRKVEETLPEYKHLKGGVYFSDDLPMTPSGKVMRRTVRDIILQMQRDEVSQSYL